MPVYIYEVINKDGSGSEQFEVRQPMSAPPLTFHPETGVAVRRVYLAPNIASRYTPGATKRKLSTGNVERAGFTKYERDKLTGKYHRVAGKEGPSELRPG